MPPTEQQLRVINHEPDRHGRVVAGPGTGKSWTAIELLTRLHDQRPDLGLGLLTFTRAATGELLTTAAQAGIDWLRPGTIHSFALRLLVRNPGTVPIPYPIRIPDTWETQTLIYPYLSAKLRAGGFEKVTVKHVEKLEREMSARWESLDPNLVVLAHLDPQLRNAYLAAWTEHRQRFGYLLLAELPSRAGDLLDDFNVDLQNLRFLVVDEYQDLNRADIRLIGLLADRGVRVLAIGDDDQSIYGFRMAAPAGLREFHGTFPNAAEYPLSISQRCGRRIIEVATTVIETAAGRPQRERLTPKEGAVDGHFAYLRFNNDTAEARGVARIIAARIAAGAERKKIVVLVRSQVADWVNLLGPELEALGIPFMDADWVERTLEDPILRRSLAVARLTQDRTDSLAWWTLLKLVPGIAPEFRDYVESRVGAGETAGQALLRLHPAFDGAPTENSRTAARRLITEQLAVVDALNLEGVELDEEGWGGWLKRRVEAGTLSADAEALLAQVGRAVPPDEGLGHFLGQLEPVGKDLAAQADAVRIMSITTSKGLTVNTAIVMGVEAGIIPHPRGTGDEELRLLYVAMTRGKEAVILTGAARRTGRTARHGSGNAYRRRGRCPLLQNLPIGQWQDGAAYVAALAI